MTSERLDELRERFGVEAFDQLTPEQLAAIERCEETDDFPSVPMPRAEPFPSAITFCCTPETGRRHVEAKPQAIFRGEGLWLWGADETTKIHGIFVGCQNCFLLTLSPPIPGLYFEAGLSSADFNMLLTLPRADWQHERLRELPPLPPHQQLRLLTAEVGNNLYLDVEGPIRHAVMWGKTVR